MRSRNDTSLPHAPRPEPATRRTRTSRALSGSPRRRVTPPEAVPNVPPPHGPISLYRAEKARRASTADDAVMIEAKRAYDALVAEQGAKRAGMRSSVVSTARRGRKPAAAG